MKLRVPLALATLALVAPGSLLAAAGTTLGEGSRDASLARSSSARTGEVASFYSNPATLTDLARPTLGLMTQLAYLRHSWARYGEQSEDHSRWLTGVGLAVATPLPGPLWLREHMSLGLALHLPGRELLSVRVPERADAPGWLFYDNRADHLAFASALGLRLLEGLRLGLGFSLVPTLATPTEVSYVAERGGTAEENVEVRLDRELRLDTAPFIGLRWEPASGFALAVTYHTAQVARAAGNQRTLAPPLLADDPIDYHIVYNPATLTLGSAFELSSKSSLSMDLAFARWSELVDARGEAREPPLADTLAPRVGFEHHLIEGARLRAGAAYEPSPVREQVAVSNTLDADRFVVATGAGFTLFPQSFPMVLDLHLRAHLGLAQFARKRNADLPDADPVAPGKQITNLGYPGFRARTQVWQLGWTWSFFLDAPPTYDSKGGSS